MVLKESILTSYALWENYGLFEKLKKFAQKGNGRRLLNTLNKKETILTPIELEELLSVYRDIGLPIEVEALKKRRSILKDDHEPNQNDDLGIVTKQLDLNYFHNPLNGYFDNKRSSNFGANP